MVRSRLRLTDKFPLIGNHRCVDFVNTESIQRGRRVDLLADFPDLVAWSTAAHLLGPVEAAAVLRRWGNTPAGARTLVEARRLRTRLRDMLEQVARGRPIASSTIEAINTILARHIGRSELARSDGGFVRRFRFEFRSAVDLLVPVAEAAADFLCQADLSLVRKCANPPCLRYFYDVSRNHTRRWCSMGVCGNRAKVAAYHHRSMRRRR
jgi:predicted RNA-binding Zn ribbon-like protein